MSGWWAGVGYPRSTLSVLASIGFVALGIVAPANEQGAIRGARLEWTAPASCPDRAHVVAEIKAILGPAAPGDPAAVAAHAEVTADETGHRLSIRIDSPSGSRSRALQAADCADLAAYTAVLVAIAIDPGATPAPDGAARVEPPASPASQAKREPATPALEDREDPPKASSRRPAGSVLAFVGPSLGTLPSATGVVGLGGALRWPTIRIDLGVAHRIAQTTSRVALSDATADLWAIIAHADVCGVPHVPRVEFPLCGGLEAGALAGRARGVTDPGSGRAPWLAFRVGAGLLAVPWRRVALGVRGTLQIPVVRARFGIDGVGELHRVGAVGGEITAVVEVRFP